MDQDISGLQEAKKAITRFSYIRFTFFDMNGVPRGIVAPAKAATKFLDSGIGCFAGAQVISLRGGEVLPKEVYDIHLGNAKIIPDLTTLHPVTWLKSSSNTTGQFICGTYWNKSSPQEACSRYIIVKKQLEKLGKMGLVLYSGMELEFTTVDSEKKNPIFSPSQLYSMLAYTQFHDFFTEMEQNASKVGVDVNTMHIELMPGQFECTTVPQFVMKGIDNPVILKQSIKELAVQKGLQAHFMAQHSSCDGSRLHVNISIWTKDREGNMFFDDEADDKLSEFAKHWIAGILHHAPALTALCCPTADCYHVMDSVYCSHFANWGIQDRGAMIRVKNDGPSGTYIENRLPTGLANPYLVMAGIVAAGIDGVHQRIPSPKPHNKTSAQRLPRSLQEALACLQKDDIMVDAFGKTFIKWFVMSKTSSELNCVDGITDEIADFELHSKKYESL